MGHPHAYVMTAKRPFNSLGEPEKKRPQTLSIMKNPKSTNVILRSVFALAMAATVLSPLLAQPAAPASGSMMTAGTMAERHQAMQSQREKMMAEMKAQDTELKTQLARVKSAPDAQKVDLLIAVVGRMLEQRAAMHMRMDEMMNRMMGDMPMEHGSMSSRPMKKGMKDKPAGTTEKQN